MEEGRIETGFEKGNPLEKKLSQYIREINCLRRECNLEELQILVDRIIHILPSNVKSLSIPIFGCEETIYLTGEKELSSDETKGTDWSLGNLISYSISLKEPCDDEIGE